MTQISRGKFDCLHRALAGFTDAALDGYGLCDSRLARPATGASDPIPVRRVAVLLGASSRRRLATPPLRFANPSPPSAGLLPCGTGDFQVEAYVEVVVRRHVRLSEIGFPASRGRSRCDTVTSCFERHPALIA